MKSYIGLYYPVRVNRKGKMANFGQAYLTCQKYEYQEILEELQVQVNSALDTGEIGRVNQIMDEINRIQGILSRIEVELASDQDDNHEVDENLTAGQDGFSFPWEFDSVSQQDDEDSSSDQEQSSISDLERAYAVALIRRALAVLRARTEAGQGEEELSFDQLLNLEDVETPVNEKGQEKILKLKYSDIPAEARREKNIQCSICLEDFQADDPVSLLKSCAHAFHTDCVVKWFESKSKCPVCKDDLNDEVEGEGDRLST